MLLNRYMRSTINEPQACSAYRDAAFTNKESIFASRARASVMCGRNSRFSLSKPKDSRRRSSCSASSCIVGAFIPAQNTRGERLPGIKAPTMQELAEQLDQFLHRWGFYSRPEHPRRTVAGNKSPND